MQGAKYAEDSESPRDKTLAANHKVIKYRTVITAASTL